MIRVLIVDDSPTIRELVRHILERDPEMTVVGEARNGKEAVELCLKLNPDVITMDIQMPHMDGYEAIQHIMAESPRPIVVLTSSESDVKYGATFKGINAGALMVIRKPLGIPGEDPEADKLVSQVKAMAGVKVVRRRWKTDPKAPVPNVGRRDHKEAHSPFKIIAIGASTGGPPAIRTVLDQLPIHLPIPVVIVQHISFGFIKGFARWLNDTTPFSVKVAENGEGVKPGVVYLATDNRHLHVGRKGRLWLMDSAAVDGHRPSVTALFQSVARNYSEAAIGVLLTGMGRDGAIGLKMLEEAGAEGLVQAQHVLFHVG